jgi:hypothetical protein
LSRIEWLAADRLQIVDAPYSQLFRLAAAHAPFKAQFAMAVKSAAADIGPPAEDLPLDAARVMNGRCMAATCAMPQNGIA